MENYVEILAAAPDAKAQRQLLTGIIGRPWLHARLLNSLSRMEYVGVRKILKSRRSESLDYDGLQHILEEAAHALRLKKAALAMADNRVSVATYSDADTLAGDAGEAYLQGVDRAAQEVLSDIGEDRRDDLNYILTSAAVEVRAQAFYPLYESCLRAQDVKVSVSAIVRDESRHLSQMAAFLSERLPEWRSRLEKVLEAEKRLFGAFLSAVSQKMLDDLARQSGAA